MATKAINIRKHFESDEILRPIPYYPVGTILAFTNSSFNPQTLYEGTWSRYAQYRILVAYQSGSTYFGTLGGTTGSLYLQSHSHTYIGSHTHTVSSHTHTDPYYKTNDGYGTYLSGGSSLFFAGRIIVTGGTTYTDVPNTTKTSGMVQTSGTAGGFSCATSGSGVSGNSNIMQSAVVAWWRRTA